MSARTRKSTQPTPKPKATPAPANCGCGCGVPTVSAKATFLAGHDARHAGNLGRALAANPDDAQAVAAYKAASPKLQAKIRKVEETAKRKAASKEAAKEAKVAAKEAYDKVLASYGV